MVAQRTRWLYGDATSTLSIYLAQKVELCNICKSAGRDVSHAGAAQLGALYWWK